MKQIVGYLKNGLIVIGMMILSQLSIIVFSLFKGVLQFTGNKASLSLLENSIVAIVTVLNVALLIFIAKKLRIISFNFGWVTKKNIGLILLGFLAMRIVAVVGIFLKTLTEQNQITTNDLSIGQLFTGESPIIIFILIAIAAPIMEEIVCRAGIMRLLFKDNVYVGIAVSSLLFGLIHNPRSIVEFLMYSGLGFVLAYSYHKTKNLEVPIAIHILNNAVATLALFFLS